MPGPPTPRGGRSTTEERAVLDEEIAALVEAVEAYATLAPERADAARAGIEVLGTLR